MASSSEPDAPPADRALRAKSPDNRTFSAERHVLVLADNVVAMTRLLDVVDVFEGDPRVELHYRWNGADPLPNGLHELFAERGIHPVAAHEPNLGFALLITAGHSGLSDVDIPVLSLPHGIRYTKIAPETGNRKPETGNRKPETGNLRTFAGSAAARRENDPLGHRGGPPRAAGAAARRGPRGCRARVRQR